MRMPKKIISSAVALSIACGTSVCVSALNVQDIKDNAKQSAQNVIQSIYNRLPDSNLQNWKTALQLLKNKSEKYSYKNGRLYLTEGDFKYLVHLSVKKGGSYARLISYSGNDTEITVPAYADGFPVRYIYSFGELDESYRYSVKTLNVPETVKDISAADVFDLFGLENINISPENPYITSIDGVAFDNSLTKLLALPSARKNYAVPDEVLSIGRYACYASSLENITFPENLIYIGEYAFFSSPNLKEISLPQSTEIIGDYAFAHCVNLQKAVLPFNTELCYSNVFEETSDGFATISSETVKLGEEIIVSTYDRNDNSTYAFYYKYSSDKKWHTQQNFTDINIAVICPDKVGDYRICAKTKAPDGTIAKQYFDIKVTL